MANAHSSSLHWSDTTVEESQVDSTRWLSVGDAPSRTIIFVDTPEQCDALIAAATRLRETFAEGA